MDVPTGAGAPPDHLLAPLRAGPPGGSLGDRMAAMEQALDRLAARVDDLSASLDVRVSAVVAAEVQGAAADLRHTVSELGRLLVRDVGRLPQMLAQHREAIVADLLDAAGAGADGPTGGPGDGGGAGGPGDGGRGLPDAGPGHAGEGPAVTAGAVTAGAPADGGGSPAEGDRGDRRWRSRRRPQG
ncbi:MAG: hypothetical protein ABR511_09870 [Acidimicrobiales bacterium]